MFPLISNYWRLTNGFGDIEKNLSYALKSLDRLKNKYPFLLHYPEYLKFLEQHGGLTLEPIGNENSIGTFWGTGANIPHLLDDEGDPLEETPYFFFADIVDHRENFSLAFYFDSRNTSDKVFNKIIYYEGFKGVRKKEGETCEFANNFSEFLDKILHHYPEVMKEQIG